MSKMIFIVDDTDSILALTASVLEDDYPVLTMPGADRMFTLLTKKQPDLILLDIEMPGMTGYEAIAILKENPEWQDIPVIFLTGFIDQDVTDRCMGSGALAVFSKSDIETSLLDRIKEFI